MSGPYVVESGQARHIAILDKTRETGDRTVKRKKPRKEGTGPGSEGQDDPGAGEA